MQPFETARLRMRALQHSDEELYVGFFTDPDIMRYIGEARSPDAARRDFERLLAPRSRARGELMFAMQAIDTAAVVGLCGTSRILPQQLRAEVGIMLKSDARGMGFATEGLAGTLDAVFGGYPPVQRIEARCSSLNASVERMVVGIGFRLADPAAAAHGPLAMRRWFVQRSSWIQGSTTCQQGDQLCRT